MIGMWTIKAFLLHKVNYPALFRGGVIHKENPNGWAVGPTTKILNVYNPTASAVTYRAFKLPSVLPLN